MQRATRGGSRMLRATLFLVGTLTLAACGNESERMQRGAALTGGDPHRGREQIRRYGCNACHTVAGVPGADALVGPPLAGIGSRMYIAGVLSNTPANMVRWIQNPPAVDSLTAMPNVGVTERDARDIAAYLYALK